MCEIPKKKRVRLKGKALKILIGGVLARDNFTCQYGKFCKKGSYTPIDAHHIVYKSRLGPDSKENLITLCRKCHDQVHKLNISITRNEYYEWVFEIPESKILK